MPKLSPGGKLTKVLASEWNGFIDAANWVRQNAQNVTAVSGGAMRRDNIALVRNAGNAQLPAYSPVVLTNLAVKPDADTGAPLIGNTPAFDAEKPSASNLTKPAAVLLEPLAAGKVGRAILCGVTPVRVTISAATDEFAGVDATGELLTAPTGAFRLLWKDTGTGANKWAVAQFPYATGGGGEIRLMQVVSVNTGAHTVATKSIVLKSDLTQTPNFTVSDSESAVTYPYLVRS